MQANISSRDIKIDITRGEIMEYLVESREVFIEYSNLPASSFSLQCYSLSEVLIEKMAALMGRTEPRDLYDFWHLTENERMNTKDHRPEFERKAKNKSRILQNLKKKCWRRKKI